MKKILNKKIIFVMLPILLLLIATLIAIGITNAAGNTAEPETEQTFTEEGDGYYIWVRAVDHAGNKGPWSEASVCTGGSNMPLAYCDLTIQIPSQQKRTTPKGCLTKGFYTLGKYRHSRRNPAMPIFSVLGAVRPLR